MPTSPLAWANGQTILVVDNFFWLLLYLLFVFLVSFWFFKMSRIPASAWNRTVSWRRQRPLSCWVWKHPLCWLDCGRIKFKWKKWLKSALCFFGVEDPQTPSSRLPGSKEGLRVGAAWAVILALAPRVAACCSLLGVWIISLGFTALSGPHTGPGNIYPLLLSHETVALPLNGWHCANSSAIRPCSFSLSSRPPLLLLLPSTWR